MSSAQASVSTPTRPMAFTRDDFWCGAWTAWCVFIVILLTIMIFFAVTSDGGGGYAIITVIIGGILSMAAMGMFSPIAWAVASALRRCPWPAVHLVVFAALGGGVGLSVAVACAALVHIPVQESVPSGWTWAVMAICAICTTAGWAHAFHRARHRDRTRQRNPELPLPSVDPDITVEDRALDR